MNGLTLTELLKSEPEKSEYLMRLVKANIQDIKDRKALGLPDRATGHNCWCCGRPWE